MRKRPILIAGNWKMNYGPKETAAFFHQLGEQPQVPGLEVCIFPPDLSLSTALEQGRQLGVAVGAQNVHWESKGAFTGEISGPMLQELGITWALVGHSERRQYFGETDATANKRALSLLKQGFRVVYCIGETRAEREAGRTQEVLKDQIRGAFQTGHEEMVAQLGAQLTFAYEPVWAIGTGLTATPVQAQEAHLQIRNELAARFGESSAGKSQILYGGSVTPENIASLLACPDIDGALVGGASLKAEGFRSLVAAGKAAL